MARVRLRFTGHIAGLGTGSGTRVVLGHWTRSPYGPVSDVMLQDATGHRLLLASTPELAGFIADTYAFDEVRVVPVAVAVAGPAWRVTAGPLALRFRTGRRGVSGTVLRCVPPPLARHPAWIGIVDVPARLALPGVRTRGSAGNGRREWYGVSDLRRIVAATANLDGRDLGTLADVDPPVSFGFGSTPRTPAVVRVTTTVDTPG